ncbi:MAG TPA: TRAP transporter TatT component family protein, partial [Myxococcales bacterium]|nr:TRAP transporter TatT component family protein [Myxococcales bacterium]
PDPEASTMAADAQECAADAHRARAGAGIEAEALYLWAVCSAIWSRMQGFTPLIERRGELTAAFLRVAQLDPDLDGAGAERELGALYAALPAYAGGDLEEARRYLLAAVQRAPEDARNHVVLARAVAVKAQDRALFREHLMVAAKSGDALAAAQARALLERERELFGGPAEAAQPIPGGPQKLP